MKRLIPLLITSLILEKNGNGAESFIVLTISLTWNSRRSASWRGVLISTPQVARKPTDVGFGKELRLHTRSV